ncbi:patched domain-containing protein 3-like [Antedon mediterranea]|uniref:patched domain-containing protein 3-like n=1 Tax=Antedon mediterranea TaxID=105859 RepID=UPI003AF87CBA
MAAEKGEPCCNRVSNAIISTFESLFKRIGSFVGQHSWICIFVSVVVTIGFGIGFTMIKIENRREKLWVPAESDNQDYLRYVSENYKDPFLETIIFENENILTPESFKAMFRVDELVKAIDIGKSWESICFRSGESCFVNSIFELWGFNKTVIERLSQEEILQKINEDPISAMTGNEVDVLSYLGGVDDETYITSASTAIVIYGLQDNSEFDESAGEYVDPDAEEWELEFIDIFTADQENVTVYGFSETSFSLESSKAIVGDTYWLAAGYGLLFVYITFMLSKFNRIEHKVYIALSGIITVGFAVCVSIGFGSILGFIYTPVHSVLPFLLLGIGVDDMFVIVQSWDNLSEDEKNEPVSVQCALALQHAGVSITVTSVTDFCAFVIGATTILPALRSFCIFCGIGIIFLYFFSVVFFTATLCLDIRRVKDRRNACCCCFRASDDYEPSQCSRENRLQRFFEDIYAPVLITTSAKVVVLLITATFLGFGIWGLLELKQYFDFRWFLPPDSYTIDFIDVSEKYYPRSGLPSSIYLNEIDVFNERSTIDALYEDAKQDPYVDPASFESWYNRFGEWIQANKQNTLGYNNATMWPDTRDTFYTWLFQFLNDPTGGIHTPDIIFDETMNITSSRINFNHVVFQGSAEEVKGMDSMLERVSSVQFEGDGNAFVFSPFYLDYESNKVIQDELLRNMGLACACVFVIILLLLANLLTCCLVFMSVLFTLIDLAGFAHHWGLTIDTVVTINLILSIGIAIDYAAHIGHSFMTVTGTKNERAQKAITCIAPAVFNGGLSTLLAFIMLSISQSYIFKTFFKVFLLVVLFGLFHGLVLLPVLLSWFGPAPYASALISPTGTDISVNGHVIGNVESQMSSDTKHFDNSAYNSAIDEKENGEVEKI